MAQDIITGRRSFLLKASLALAGTMIPATSLALSPWVNSLTSCNKSNFRILAFTDLHFGQLGHKIDKLTVRDMQKMNDHFRPDLIVVTGDAWFENPQGHGLGLCQYFCRAMADLGCPWAFVLGNHDKADDFEACEQIIATTPGALYRGFASNGHYRLQITFDSAVSWNLIFINNAQRKMGFRISQVNWLKNELSAIQAESVKVAPAMLFCHIPLDAYRLVLKSGTARGICLEDVSSERCHHTAMSAVAQDGLIKAMFCGHDHLNNFKGTWQGVQLEYLRSTGWAGYGGEILPKGGTLIDLASDATYLSRTVFANGLEWQTPQRVGKFFSFLP